VRDRLRAIHPDARCALNFASPFQLLVATILSAQCTDERVNQVTPELFRRFPTPAAMAAADRDAMEQLVLPTGFFRQKSRYIQEASAAIVERFGGEVPQSMAELLTLSGVARKTANVVLGVAFGIAEGVVVDTHVRRVAGRLRLSNERDPAKIELDLMKKLPRRDWIDASHLFIFHGRRVCHARRPDCPGCVLVDICPSAQV
jgi:endonuclease-3